MEFEELREKAHSLPLKPGVYIMQNAKNEVIYVGKAKALKNRVSQYFQDQSRHNDKTRAMVSQIDHFDVIIVQSEFEALVLECSLIKRHQPRYNILLKDDKGYPFICVNVKEEYPRFSLANRADNDTVKYFGPYGSRGASQGIIDALLLALKLPTCHKKFPRDIGKERPCLNFQMGRCDGYCRKDMDQTQYREGIDRAIRLLEGHFEEVAAELTGKMEQASEELRFEQAAQIRDQIKAIRLLATRQKAVAGSLADTDVIGWNRGTRKCCFVVLHYVGGELAAKDWQVLDAPMEENESEILSDLTAQYYNGRQQLPKQILLPYRIEQQEDLSQLFSETMHHKVEILIPQRGKKLDLVRLANENAQEELQRGSTSEERQSWLMETLGRLLGLSSAPHRIESFDISNTGASDMVASMIVYEDGKPRKRDYRSFKLKNMEHPDDYLAMRQVVGRRFQHYLEGDKNFGSMPDLLLIDGGAGQVSAVKSILNEVNIAVPVYGMVKDSHHHTRALIDEQGREIGIQQNQAIFSLIGEIQEDTHRFAIQFHHQQQSQRLEHSLLDEIPGIGPSRKSALLKQFKSIQAIQSANLEELTEVLPKNAALSVYRFFQHENHKEENP